MKKIKEYVIELSLIVFGVFIAISVDDYRERSKTDAMLKSYLNVLTSDLTDNMKLLEEEIYYDSITLSRLAAIRDKVTAKDYKSLDSLTLTTLEHSSFTLNDTGFRMIMQSGNSHSIETAKLARLTDLFGAAMTDLKFYQETDFYFYDGPHKPRYGLRSLVALCREPLDYNIGYRLISHIVMSLFDM